MEYCSDLGKVSWGQRNYKTACRKFESCVDSEARVAESSSSVPVAQPRAAIAEGGGGGASSAITKIAC